MEKILTAVIVIIIMYLHTEYQDELWGGCVLLSRKQADDEGERHDGMKIFSFLVKIPVMQMTGSSSSVVTDSPKAYKSLFYGW